MTLILPTLSSKNRPSLEDEQRRLEELYSLDVLASSSDARFAHYTELAASVLRTPMASVVLAGKDGLKFKSVIGRGKPEALRDASFAEHTMEEEGLLIVPDASVDPRFSRHPLVEGESRVRAYIGAALHGPSGQSLGAICVMDCVPRRFSKSKRRFLLRLAQMLEHEMQDRVMVAEQHKKMKEHAIFDSASGLPREAFFKSRLTTAIESKRSRSFLVALIRLESYEAIHSAVGKSGAGYIVAEAASRVNKALNRSCLMGQIREDTIALAFDTSRISRPASTIAKLLRSFSAPFTLGEHMVVLSVGIGATMFPKDAENAEALIKRARTALHSMPSSDTSKYRLYDRQLSAEATRIFKIQSGLKDAIARNELQLVYQPKISLADGSLAGAEALLRWTSEDLGVVSPTEFIPVAEESELIVELGAWTLRTACQQVKAWDADGHLCPEVSVNLSAFQLRQPRLYKDIANLLKQTSLDSRRLNLEITEGSLIENIDSAVQVMHRLRKLGVTFSIDDFGKGFSSLSYLRRMPVQTLKIDREFIARLPGQREDIQLIRSIVSMGHALNLKVVAEGAETKAQLDALRSTGCDQVQGFGVARPQAPDNFFSDAPLIECGGDGWT